MRVVQLTLALLDVAKRQPDLDFAEEIIRCTYARLMPSKQFHDVDDELFHYTYLRSPEEQRAEIVSWLTHPFSLLWSEWGPVVRAWWQHAVRWLLAVEAGDGVNHRSAGPARVLAVPVAACTDTDLAIDGGIRLDEVPWKAATTAGVGAVEIGRVHDDLFLLRNRTDSTRPPLRLARQDLDTFLDRIKRGDRDIPLADSSHEEK